MNTIELKENTQTQAPQKKPLPQLVKGQFTYKLVVPEKVEEKIRYLIHKFPNTEWSGVLFCSHKGTFEDKDLVITCEDIFPMDLGSSGWTEFKMTEDVAAYMAEHIELFDCDTQLIHSHHVLGAYMSGQDMKMVQQEGNDTNCFVSLVVDTKGSYVAIVTRKINIQAVYAITVTNRTYEFFGEGSKQIDFEDDEDSKRVSTTNKEVIEYSDLEVERHEVTLDLENVSKFKYLDDRFDEIEAKKEAERKKHLKERSLWNTYEEGGFFDDFYKGKYSKTKFFENQEDKLPLNLDTEWTPSPKKVHEAVVHILTCSLILNPDKIDLKQWVTRHMCNMYIKIFGKECKEEVMGDGGLGAFGNWRDFILQHTLDFFDYSDAPNSLMEDFDLAQSKVAEAMIEELEKYATFLREVRSEAILFLDSYIEVLSCYVIE